MYWIRPSSPRLWPRFCSPRFWSSTLAQQLVNRIMLSSPRLWPRPFARIRLAVIQAGAAHCTGLESHKRGTGARPLGL